MENNWETKLLTNVYIKMISEEMFNYLPKMQYSLKNFLKNYIWDILKKPVFEKIKAIWMDKKNEITKKYNNKRHSLTMLKPTQAFSK